MNLSFNEISDGLKSNVLDHKFQSVFNKESNYASNPVNLKAGLQENF